MAVQEALRYALIDKIRDLACDEPDAVCPVCNQNADQILALIAGHGETTLASDLESLVKAWRAQIAKFPPAREFSREAGFFSALTTCTIQLEETLRKARES